LNHSPKDIALLLWPSLRSVAYLQVLMETEFFPNEIILLKNNYKVYAGLKKESKKYNYKRFFNIEIGVDELLEHKNVKIIKLNTSDINSPEVLQSMQKLNNKYIIFTGGGILSKEILSLQKIFVHIHSGIIPEYRGSTCFYYSVIKDFSLGATAYIMDEIIDAGEIILQRNFTLNYYLNNDQPFFLDYVLDNYIRSQVLKEMIQLFKKKTHFNTVFKDCSGFAYYIMHPLLRHLTIKKINSRYSSIKEQGVIMKE